MIIKKLICTSRAFTRSVSKKMGVTRVLQVVTLMNRGGLESHVLVKINEGGC